MELPVSIVDRGSVLIGVRLIQYFCGEVDHAEFERRSVGRKDLKSGSGLTVGIRRTVQGQAGGLFTAAADDAEYVAVFRVDHCHGCLRLFRSGKTFRNDLIVREKNVFFILIDIGLRFFFAVEKKIEFRILAAEMKLKHFTAVMLKFSVRMFYGKRPVQSISRDFREVALVFEFILHYILYL